MHWHKFFISLLQTLRSGIRGSYGKYTLNFIRNCQSVFQGGYTILHFTNSAHRFNLHVLKSLKLSSFLYCPDIYFQTCFLIISSVCPWEMLNNTQFPPKWSILSFIVEIQLLYLWSNTLKQWFIPSVYIMFNLIFILHHCFILFCNLNLSGLVKLLFFPHSYFPLMDTDNQDFTPLILGCFIGPLTLITVQLKVLWVFWH